MVGNHHLERSDTGFHNPLIQAGEEPYEVGHTTACNHSAQAILYAISQAAYCSCTIDPDQAVGVGIGQQLYQPFNCSELEVCELPAPITDDLVSYASHGFQPGRKVGGLEPFQQVTRGVLLYHVCDHAIHRTIAAAVQDLRLLIHAQMMLMHARLPEPGLYQCNCCGQRALGGASVGTLCLETTAGVV